MSSMCMDGYPYLRMKSLCSSLLNVDWYLRLKWIEKCVKTSTFMKISYMQRASSVYSLTFKCFYDFKNMELVFPHMNLLSFPISPFPCFFPFLIFRSYDKPFRGVYVSHFSETGISAA